jgi:hypothetical protein
MSDTHTRTLRRIKSVEPRPGYRLAISWERGPGVTVDLSEMISRGGVFADLTDKEKFSAVRIGENNRIIEWPMPEDDYGYPIISIDADALYIKSSQQNVESMATMMRTLLDTIKATPRRAPTSAKT